MILEPSKTKISLSQLRMVYWNGPMLRCIKHSRPSHNHPPLETAWGLKWPKNRVLNRSDYLFPTWWMMGCNLFTELADAVYLLRGVQNFIIGCHFEQNAARDGHLGFINSPPSTTGRAHQQYAKRSPGHLVFTPSTHSTSWRRGLCFWLFSIVLQLGIVKRAYARERVDGRNTDSDVRASFTTSRLLLPHESWHLLSCTKREAPVCLVRVGSRLRTGDLQEPSSSVKCYRYLEVYEHEDSIIASQVTVLA